jgi:esterase
VTAPILSHEIVRSRGGEDARAGGPARARPPTRWIYFLHGIFGSGRNWRSVARRWVDAGAGRGGVLVDLRLHGGSTGFPPPHTIHACAEDVARLAERTGLTPGGILGHSFGGKVALAVAASPPAGLDVVWVVDSTPSARQADGSAVRMMAALRAEGGPFDTREQAESALMAHGFVRPVARWMTTNLAQTDGRWRWTFDLNGLDDLLADFFRTDLWKVVEEPPGELQLHFVKAVESSVLSEADCERIEAAAAATGRVHLHRVQGGHWLNMDAPDAILALLEAGLRV